MIFEFSLNFFAGIGSGFAYTCAVVAVGIYFEKYRPIAFGLSTLGIGVATMCFPWITSALIAHYGWRGALMITSGLVFNVCVAAMLIFPIQPQDTTWVTTKSDAASKGCLAQSRKIFTNIRFTILCINVVLFNIGFTVVYTHIAAYAESEGHSSNFGNLLITVLGIATIGKHGCIILTLEVLIKVFGTAATRGVCEAHLQTLYYWRNSITNLRRYMGIVSLICTRRQVTDEAP